MFEDEVENKSCKCVTIPVWIEDKMDTMDVEIVENNIPLLTSKPDMKEMKMHVNFPNDTAVVGGKKINLGCSSMGHYYIPIAKEKVSVNYCNVVLHASNLAKMSRNEKLKKAIKLQTIVTCNEGEIIAGGET